MLSLATTCPLGCRKRPVLVKSGILVLPHAGKLLRQSLSLEFSPGIMAELTSYSLYEQ